MASAQTTVGLVEPVALFRDAIAGFIDSQPGLRVEFAIASERELQDLYAPQVDVLLLCATLVRTTFSPQAILDHWQTRTPNSRIILMTDCCARQAITAFLRSGLRGYLIRANLAMLELIEAIHVVADGSIKLCHETRQVLFSPEPTSINLTRRELEVVRVLPELRFKKRTFVARELGMSPANLNNYISEIARKLDVYGADGIVERAFELGLLAVIDQRESSRKSSSREANHEKSDLDMAERSTVSDRDSAEMSRS